MKLTLVILILSFMTYKSTGQTVSNEYHDETFQTKEFKPPISKAEWIQRKIEIRKTILKCLGDIPKRPKKLDVKIISRDTTGEYSIEHFEFYNGVDAIVPGIVLIPKNIKGKAPAILYHHYHGGEYGHGKDELFGSKLIPFAPGVELVKAGYIVLSIDAYAFGDRSGKGPDGTKEKGQSEEFTWAKLNLWKGRSLWGMMVRDDLMALDYLASRSDVDADRLASIGLSLGCFRTFYVAALDDRIKVAVPVSCITRNADLIREQRISGHGIYYYVPGLLNYFDTESIMACIAPRALLNLSGADDTLEPLEGQRYINNALEKVYRVMQKPDQFQYKIYDGVGHAYTEDMWLRTIKWLKEKL